MERMRYYGHYSTGNDDTNTEHYTWEDLYAAINSMEMRFLSEEDKKCSIEIGKYFLANPGEAINGKLESYRSDSIQSICRELIDRD